MQLNLLLKNKAVEVKEPWRMLLWLLAAQIMVAFIGRSLGPLGVLIGMDLSLSKAQIGLLPSALFLGQSISSIPAGFLVDRVGSRKLLLIISLCTGISFLFMTMSSQFALIMILVMIGGLGYGAMHPVTNRGIIYWFSLKQRGTAMGIKQTGITGGAALASLLLLPAAVAFGWRPVLFFACFLLIIIGFAAFKGYRDPLEAQTSKQGSIKSMFRSLLQLFRHKQLLLVSLSATGLNGSQMCLTTYLVLFAHEHFHLSIVMSGMLLLISEVSGSAGRVAWGMISDRIFNGRRIIILIMIAIITAICSVTVTFLPQHTPFIGLVPIISLFGFAVSGFNGIWMNLASELVPKEFAGISSGFSILFGSAGVIIMPPLFGYLIDRSGTYMYGWYFISCLMIAVLILLFILRKQQQSVSTITET